MNERIKDLMGKTLDSEFSHTWDTMTYEGLLQFSEKFAELMLVEFTETVKQTATLVAQTGFNDGLSIEEVNKRVNGALRVLDVMRERFGVE